MAKNGLGPLILTINLATWSYLISSISKQSTKAKPQLKNKDQLSSWIRIQLKETVMPYFERRINLTDDQKIGKCILQEIRRTPGLVKSSSNAKPILNQKRDRTSKQMKWSLKLHNHHQDAVRAKQHSAPRNLLSKRKERERSNPKESLEKVSLSKMN